MSIFYKDGYNYQLKQDYLINTGLNLSVDLCGDYLELYKGGLLVIKKGYAWDGATCAIDTNNFMRGSLVHDAMYQLIRDGAIDKKHRVYADKLLHKILLEDGMSKFRAGYVYLAVKQFGAPHADPAKDHPLLQAPK